MPETKTMTLQQKALATLMSLVFALSMSLAIAPSAFAATTDTQTGGMSSPSNCGTNIADSGDTPYYVVNVNAGAFTRPSQFWTGTGVSDTTGTATNIGGFIVDFHNMSNGSDMVFDLSDADGWVGPGIRAFWGPLYANGERTGQGENTYAGQPLDKSMLGDGSVACVWSSAWMYAYRLSPYSAVTVDENTSARTLSFAWKGCFATYFNSWDYTIDAATLTGVSNLAEDTEIVLTYKSGYYASQTSRGTNYTINADDSTLVDLVIGYDTNGDPLEAYGDPMNGTTATSDDYTISGYVDEDGNVTFSGIKYGGNYTVSIA